MARSQGSHVQGVRLIKLLRRLQGRFEGIRLGELEREFEVSRSQLRRDLLALEEAGIRLQVEQEQGRYGHGRVRLLDADTTGLISGRTSHHVVVDLDNTARAEAAARTWHRTQRSTPLADGGTRVEFDVTSLREVVAWVLGWGEAAHVVGPQELRERVVASLNGALRGYSG